MHQNKNRRQTDHLTLANQHINRKEHLQVNAVTSLVGELAYELAPTSDQQIMQIDSLLNQ